MQLTTNLCHYARFASLRCIPLSNLQRDLEIHFLKLYALRTEKKNRKVKTFVGISKQFLKKSNIYF